VQSTLASNPSSVCLALHSMNCVLSPGYYLLQTDWHSPVENIQHLNMQGLFRIQWDFCGVVIISHFHFARCGWNGFFIWTPLVASGPLQRLLGPMHWEVMHGSKSGEGLWSAGESRRHLRILLWHRRPAVLLSAFISNQEKWSMVRQHLPHL
jgi:hypothetical protein